MEQQQVPADTIADITRFVEINEPYPDGDIDIMAELRNILGFEDGDQSSKDSTLGNGLSSWGCMDCQGFGNGDDQNSASLNLKLNYQEVLDAWSDRGSLWADHDLDHDHSLSMTAEVAVVEEERSKREASVLRYKEKRQSRLFEKKIRYQIHKFNAYKRPRFKGRFVKRVC